MTADWRLAENLTPADVQEHPVWEFVTDVPDAPDTAVRPVDELPVQNLSGRLVGIRIRLRNGSWHWAILSNVSLRNPRATKHFLCIVIEKNGRWFELARYHDVDFERRSPTQLAKFLDLPLADVFPMEYDISDFADGEPSVIKGTVPETPEERLTDDQLIELSL